MCAKSTTFPLLFRALSDYIISELGELPWKQSPNPFLWKGSLQPSEKSPASSHPAAFVMLCLSLHPLSAVRLGSRALPMTCQVEQYPEWLVQAGPHPALLLASSSGPSSTCPGKRWIKSRRVGHSKVSFLSKTPGGFLNSILAAKESRLCLTISHVPSSMKRSFPPYWCAKSKRASPGTCHLNKNRFIMFCQKDTCYSWNSACVSQEESCP